MVRTGRDSSDGFGVGARGFGEHAIKIFIESGDFVLHSGMIVHQG